MSKVRRPCSNGGAAYGALEVLEGPCCEDLACPSRDAWPYPHETFEQFLARVGQAMSADRRRETYR